ncbi:MAG TPA: phosphoribosylanthranilate isomerase [Phycisphaerae bacterium]|nr:phosphoribosylanthranilate isomerase [Phycisphaerae bacterium]
MRVKICGITSGQDAALAVQAGADAIGIMFAPSPRKVDRNAADRIVSVLPPFVVAVGVFVDAPLEWVREMATGLHLGAVQLSGDEPLEYVAALAPLRVIKAVRVVGPESLEAPSSWARGERPANLAAIHLDTGVAGQHGGTGRSFDWSLAADLRRSGGAALPMILAGGLRPENVAEAVRVVRPYAVDVSSGVEAEPGRKDPEKVRRFVAEARSVPDA